MEALNRYRKMQCENSSPNGGINVFYTGENVTVLTLSSSVERSSPV